MEENVCAAGPTLPPGFNVEGSKDERSSSIGPALPPGFNVEGSKDERSSSIGPALPPGFNMKGSEDERSSSIGPALPPGFTVEGSKNERSSSIGPALPPGFNMEGSEDKQSSSIGPALPPGFTVEASKDQRSSSIGPALPPGFNMKGAEDERSSSIGPALPPGFNMKGSEDERSSSNGPSLPPGFNVESSKDERSSSIGPALPPGFIINNDIDDDDDDDEDEIGPMPSTGGGRHNEVSVASDFERRSKKMKDKLEGKDDATTTTSSDYSKRESWMTELPSDHLSVGLGLVSRQFSTKSSSSKNSDRSGWTDTPADRERKAREGHVSRVDNKHDDQKQRSKARDAEISQQVDDYNNLKRKESLVDMHQKKLKKAKKADSNEPKSRRPFSREDDLQINRFDDAKRKALIKKSQDLNNRFSHGGTTGKFI
ncbi:uncharacterized protein LOC141911252 [Tubulanus polymorphus]|uniref:uncharacterized protein LOC141911252 n=1 Tax=Tubulanus polymorphus TaxID=672921 RepID=UPI003DA3FD44